MRSIAYLEWLHHASFPVRKFHCSLVPKSFVFPKALTVDRRCTCLLHLDWLTNLWLTTKACEHDSRLSINDSTSFQKTTRRVLTLTMNLGTSHEPDKKSRRNLSQISLECLSIIASGVLENAKKQGRLNTGVA